MCKERIELVPDTAKCSGCGACMAVCPRQAISMQEGAYGCKYPVIDAAVCVKCGKCLQICPHQNLGKRNAPDAALAAVGKADDVVRNSASGGVFAALALEWIKSGGFVSGAVMESAGTVQVFHVLSDCEDGIGRMQGSKYVQSDAWRCYFDVVNALREGKRVLFSGTPCQVAAVRALTGDPDHLTTIDLICHGVPPAKMLNDYLRLLEKRFRGKISSFLFRDKRACRPFCARFDVQRSKKKRSYYLSSSMLSFYKHFLKGVFYRESCYSCPYAGIERIADITIGDYWGIETVHAQDLNSGIMPARSDWSCVLVNTEKGRRLLDEFGGGLALYPTQVQWVVRDNHQLQHASVKPAMRASMIKRYEREGYAAVEETFMQEFGGRLRYHVRMVKQLLTNQKACKDKAGSKNED